MKKPRRGRRRDWRRRRTSLVVVDGPGQGVERQHRPADDVEPHLHVEAAVEELELLRPSEPPRQEAALDLAFRLAEHRQDREDDGQDRSAGDGIERGAVEPVPRHPG